jgi:hypothetical protein
VCAAGPVDRVSGCAVPAADDAAGIAATAAQASATQIRFRLMPQREPAFLLMM